MLTKKEIIAEERNELKKAQSHLKYLLDSYSPLLDDDSIAVDDVIAMGTNLQKQWQKVDSYSKRYFEICNLIKQL